MAVTGELDPTTVGDGHIDALSGGSARVAVEYKAGRREQPFDLARILSTVDGAALTHRVYAIRELPSGAVTRIFRGRWHGDDAAVVRYAEEGGWSIHVEPDDLTPASLRNWRPSSLCHRVGPAATRPPSPTGWR